jgi:hypothetical protein
MNFPANSKTRSVKIKSHKISNDEKKYNMDQKMWNMQNRSKFNGNARNTHIIHNVRFHLKITCKL